MYKVCERMRQMCPMDAPDDGYNCNLGNGVVLLHSMLKLIA